MNEEVKLFKVLADSSRLKIIASLLEESLYVEIIAKRLNLNPSTVSFHLRKLEQLSLVSSKKDQYYTIYTLNKELLDFNILEMVNKIELNQTEKDREQQYIKDILSNFVENGNLKTIPVQRKKRQIILNYLAQDFILGKDYTEKEVSEQIKTHHSDFCTLRRDMVSEKIFTRERGIYKRIK